MSLRYSYGIHAGVWNEQVMSCERWATEKIMQVFSFSGPVIEASICGF